MTQKTTQNPWTMDVRVRERNLKSGALTEKDLEKHLAALPDAAEQAEPFGIPQPALTDHPQHVPAPVPAAVPAASISVASGSVSSVEDTGDEGDDDEGDADGDDVVTEGAEDGDGGGAFAEDGVAGDVQGGGEGT